MKTVKEILAEERQAENQQRRKADEQWRARQAAEAVELDKARDVLAGALHGMDFTEGNDGRERWFHINLAHRSVYVSYAFRNCEMRYDDESPPVTERLLKVGIGYCINQPRATTDLDSFAGAFVLFLKRERLDGGL